MIEQKPLGEAIWQEIEMMLVWSIALAGHEGLRCNLQL
jgi:hypothetical protein